MSGPAAQPGAVQPNRRTLPGRRPALTRDVTWGGHRFAVSVGVDPADGTIREVFCAGGPKFGTDLGHTIEDACVIISVALQHGVAAGDLAKSLGHAPDGLGGIGPASIIGAVVAAVCAEVEVLT